MTAVWFRTRALFRRRGTAWVGLGVVIGLFGGGVMALATGARRSEQVVLLVLLATAMLVHVLVTAVRSGRGDYATLRAVGYTRGQSRATVVWQSITLTVVAFVVGVPFGVFVGRVVWSVYARHLGLESDAFVPGAALSLTLGAAVVVSVLATLIPAWLVNRSDAAEVLRAGD